MDDQGPINNFTNLVAWQEAHALTLCIYKLTSSFPKSEQYNLISQLRRAAVSVESCIAEGFHRFHYKDRLVFFYDSRGSLAEIESQLLDAKDLNFIKKDVYHEAFLRCEKTSVILGGLIRKTQLLSKK